MTAAEIAAWNWYTPVGVIVLLAVWLVVDRWLATRPEGWTMSLGRRSRPDPDTRPAPKVEP